MVDGLDEEQHDPRVGRDSVTRRRLVFGLALAEDILYAAVALVLIGVAVALLLHTLEDLFTTEHATFVRRVGDAINGVLFVVIILEGDCSPSASSARSSVSPASTLRRSSSCHVAP